ncbi:MAG: efflux RND transporter periplasmic adaptor subunit [Candidatus Rokuibacteriota bacterium]
MRGGGRVGRALLGLLVAAFLVATGAVGAVVARRYTGESATSPAATTAATPTSPAPSAAPVPDPAADVEVLLASDALVRIGLKTAIVTATERQATIQIPGAVMANAYREVKVTPVASGIVTRTHVELGTAVKRGAPLLTLFSPELAEAQTKYLSMSAMLKADHQKLQRTTELVKIGAASRQELEEVTAVHEGRATEVEAARQRLLLLGLGPAQLQALRSPSQVVSTVLVPAPIDGVITARSANLGQVVGMGQELMVVTDLSQVWVLGDLYEQDFRAVRVGSEAALSPAAYPGLTLRGRVSYIDPRVDPQARTAKLRVEVPNADGRLRLGMYVSMAFVTRTGERRLVVPRAAVQTLGDRQVVFLPVKDEEGKFVQRTVRLGEPVGEAGYAVLAGLSPGDVVVTEGSFFLRAEGLRNSPST